MIYIFCLDGASSLSNEIVSICIVSAILLFHMIDIVHICRFWRGWEAGWRRWCRSREPQPPPSNPSLIRQTVYLIFCTTVRSRSIGAFHIISSYLNWAKTYFLHIKYKQLLLMDPRIKNVNHVNTCKHKYRHF